MFSSGGGSRSRIRSPASLLSAVRRLRPRQSPTWPEKTARNNWSPKLSSSNRSGESIRRTCRRTRPIDPTTSRMRILRSLSENGRAKSASASPAGEPTTRLRNPSSWGSMTTSKSRSLRTASTPSGPRAVPPGHGDPEVRLDRGRSDERSGLGAQLHAEFDADLIGRVVGGPETGQQATGGGHNRGRGFFKCLIGPLRYARAVLSQAAHDRPGRWLVDLDENAAALFQWEIDQALHCDRHPQQAATARRPAGRPPCALHVGVS